MMGNKILKKIAKTILLSSVVFTFAFSSIEANASGNNSTWMSELDDDILLSEISIPGTHDSGTAHVELPYVMRCQNTSISRQLANGYRYIDLRVCVDEKTEDDEVIKNLKIVHNFADCRVAGNPFSDKLLFKDVATNLYDFLDKNPDEAVIVNIKIEDDTHSVSEIQEFIHEVISENSNYWYLDDEIPYLGDVRGKIVLMTRYYDEAQTGETGIQLRWSEQNNTKPVEMPYELYMMPACRLWVQDRYKYSVEDKYEAVVDGLENCEADENTIFLNFVSTSGDGKIGHPKGYAKQLNKLLLSYELQESTSYGIIIVDFGSKALAEHIYSTNF